MQFRRATFPLISIATIAAYFVHFLRPSLRMYFSSDDAMNLYRSWAHPLTALIKANFLFFLNSPFYRPFASAWYRTIYNLAGFNPIPFHIALLALLALNVWLTYAVTRQLTDSREAAPIAALLIAYHPSFGSIFFDTGYIYDVLCFSLYFSAFLTYIRIRQSGKLPGIREIAAITVLYVCALNSKEMAVTLPVFLLLYELLYESVPLRSPHTWLDWVRSDGRGVLAIGVTTVLFVVGRALDPTDTLLKNDAYIPVFTCTRYFETSRGFVTTLFLLPREVSSAGVITLWLALFAIAWISRSRALRFAWMFLMLSAIPVAFILPRGAGQYYVPYFGWVLYAATALWLALAKVLALKPSSILAQSCAAIVLITIAGLLSYSYASPWRENLTHISIEPEELRKVTKSLHELQPEFKRDARILFLDDPFDSEYQKYNMMFAVKLSYRDDSLSVYRMKGARPASDAEKRASYDNVFDYCKGKFWQLTQKAAFPVCR